MLAGAAVVAEDAHGEAGADRWTVRISFELSFSEFLLMLDGLQLA